LKSFCEMVDILEAQDPELLKAKKPEYFWQLVSSSILTGAPYAELIIYVPYKSELDTIKEMANQHSWDGKLDENDVAFINFANDNDLPHLIDGGGYNNLYSFKWKVDAADKEMLTARVKLAVKELKTKLK